MKMKRFLALAAVLFFLFLFAACSDEGGEGGDIALSIATPDGALVSDYALTVEAGATVYDALLEVCQAEEIEIDAATVGGVYVRAIGGLAEFDQGPGSGWIYTVNGEQVQKSAGKYELNDGDAVVWHYTLDLGKDVGGEPGE